MNAVYLRNKIQDIKTRLNCGYISYDKAKEEAKPFIDEMNRIGLEVARKFNKKFNKFTFTTLMR